MKKLAAFALVLFSALLCVLLGKAYLDERAARAALRAEVQQRTAIAVEVRKRIAGELEAARGLLIERTQQHIAEGKLNQARAELARFAALQDPQIIKALALVDKELEIRKLLQESLSETAPEKLSLVYTRLAELAPDTVSYRESAAHFSSIAKKDGKAPATLVAK